jgi:hypothetical protein
MSFRFKRRALLLAGRRPWLAFFRPRWGFAMIGFPQGFGVGGYLVGQANGLTVQRRGDSSGHGLTYGG